MLYAVCTGVEIVLFVLAFCACQSSNNPEYIYGSAYLIRLIGSLRILCAN